MTRPLLEVRDLCKVFNVPGNSGGIESFVALDAVSFDLQQGGSLAIVGESGSGKTTSARIIAGLETATSGSVYFNGARLSTPRGVKDRRARARQIQMVFQDPFGSLDPRQTLSSALREILSVTGHVEKSAISPRIDELFEQVGLDSRHRDALPRNLSGGQRQRFAIARAIALEPQLLILDECVSALDVSVQAQVLNLLIDLRSRLGISYLFVSHDLAVVRQISETCIVMQHGRVVEHGPTSQILDRPEMPYTQELLAAIPRPGWVPRRRNA